MCEKSHELHNPKSVASELATFSLSPPIALQTIEDSEKDENIRILESFEYLWYFLFDIV